MKIIRIIRLQNTALWLSPSGRFKESNMMESACIWFALKMMFSLKLIKFFALKTIKFSVKKFFLVYLIFSLFKKNQLQLCH